LHNLIPNLLYLYQSLQTAFIFINVVLQAALHKQEKFK
jgi:hypothetical protein